MAILTPKQAMGVAARALEELPADALRKMHEVVHQAEDSLEEKDVQLLIRQALAEGIEVQSAYQAVQRKEINAEFLPFTLLHRAEQKRLLGIMGTLFGMERFTQFFDANYSIKDELDEKKGEMRTEVHEKALLGIPDLTQTQHNALLAMLKAAGIENPEGLAGRVMMLLQPQKADDAEAKVHLASPAELEQLEEQIRRRLDA